MSSRRTPEEQAFLDYFGAIDKRAIGRILADYRSTGPRGYATSLVLARILKVRERISSDRELAEKLACIRIYRQAIGIGRREVPAHNTFHTLRQRLGTEGFSRLHRHFVLQAWKAGLLTPPVPGLPKLVRDKIILLGDSTFLKAVTRTKGEKDEAGNWLFRDDSVAFGNHRSWCRRRASALFPRRPAGRPAFPGCEAPADENLQGCAMVVRMPDASSRLRPEDVPA